MTHRTTSLTHRTTRFRQLLGIRSVFRDTQLNLSIETLIKLLGRHHFELRDLAPTLEPCTATLILAQRLSHRHTIARLYPPMETLGSGSFIKEYEQLSALIQCSEDVSAAYFVGVRFAL